MIINHHSFPISGCKSHIASDIFLLQSPLPTPHLAPLLLMRFDPGTDSFLYS